MLLWDWGLLFFKLCHSRFFHYLDNEPFKLKFNFQLLAESGICALFPSDIPKERPKELQYSGRRSRATQLSRCRWRLSQLKKCPIAPSLYWWRRYTFKHPRIIFWNYHTLIKYKLPVQITCTYLFGEITAINHGYHHLFKFESKSNLS